jgi:hypothetical protein
MVGVVERLLAVGNSEIDDGGDAAAGSGAGAGVPVVAGDGAAERQLQVDVYVEGAGQDVLAGRVDHLRAVGLRGQARPDRRDSLAADGDVRFLRALGADDGAVGNNEVVGHGGPSRRIWCGAAVILPFAPKSHKQTDIGVSGVPRGGSSAMLA